MNPLQNVQLKTPSEMMVQSKLRLGRSAEFIAEREDLALDLVEEIQDAHWEEYAQNL